MLRQILNWYRENLDHKFAVPIVKRHRDRVFYKPVVARRPDYFMRREDIQAWIRWLKVNKAKTPVYSALAIFMVHTGPRVSEACGLHWDAVDLKSGIASIIRTVWWDRHSREPRIQNSTKTDGSVRIMHLPGPVISMLREMKLRSKPGAPFFLQTTGTICGILPSRMPLMWHLRR
jgi:integrase